MYSTNYKDLVGKTIMEICNIRAEFGRTYSNYMGVVCTDGTRVLLASFPSVLGPNPTLEEMRKTFFFTPEEICEKVKKEENIKRQRARDSEERDRKEYEKLKEKFG